MSKAPQPKNTVPAAKQPPLSVQKQVLIGLRVGVSIVVGLIVLITGYVMISSFYTKRTVETNYDKVTLPASIAFVDETWKTQTLHRAPHGEYRYKTNLSRQQAYAQLVTSLKQAGYQVTFDAGSQDYIILTGDKLQLTVYLLPQRAGVSYASPPLEEVVIEAGVR